MLLNIKKYNKYNNKIETMTLSAGNVTRMVASYSYDDIGRLVSLKRSGNAGIVNYAYNIRNWLKEAKSDRFCQNLLYENTGAYPCFNGNISRMQWQTSKDNVLRGYDFAYDGLNRLEESTYSEGAGMSQNKNRYSENILSYSPNGSIERLQRYGKKNNGTFGLIDDLSYSYNGNQVKAISDKAGSLLYDGSFDFKDGANADVEYFYDANGALVKDLNKGISNIEYDILGNLKCITFSNGFKTKYIYDAAGNKLRITHESVVTNTTDYIGNFVLEDGKLSKNLFDGGYCSFDNNQNPTFHYYEKDHLGSVRMVVNENGTIEQVNHYYQLEGYMETCHIIANTKRASTSARSSTTCMGWIGMTMGLECMMRQDWLGIGWSLCMTNITLLILICIVEIIRLILLMMMVIELLCGIKTKSEMINLSFLQDKK